MHASAVGMHESVHEHLRRDDTQEVSHQRRRARQERLSTLPRHRAVRVGRLSVQRYANDAFSLHVSVTCVAASAGCYLTW